MTNSTSINTLIASISKLERNSASLSPDKDNRYDLLEATRHYSDSFLDSLPHQLAYCATDDKGIGIYQASIREEPRPYQELLDLLSKHVDRPGINPASAGFLGYIPGGGLYTSSLGDYLADITNRFAGIFFASPGAVRMETMLLDWMRDLVGYPNDTTGGSLTSGGSIANLVGIVTARDAIGLKARNFERAVVYLTKQAHHCVSKAIRLAGMAECILNYVAMDDHYRMDPEALKNAVRLDRKKNLIPWLVIASAGTTDTGVVDPMEAIGDVCDHESLWLHVDGAYGAFFVLCEEGRKTLRGMDRSHSMVMDPHKTLFLPYGTGAILVKDRKPLYNTHYYRPNYMQDTLNSQEELSPADLSPELTKHFRGLRLWVPLLLHGLAPFRAALEEKLLLARYFHQKMSELSGFELGPYPELSVVTFRYVPEQGDVNTFNKKLIQAVQEDGRVFLSSTMLDDHFTLRIAVVVHRTHLETIDLTIQILQEKVRELERR